MFNHNNKQEQGYTEIKTAISLNPYKLNDTENWRVELAKILKKVDTQATVILTNSDKYLDYLVSFYGYQYNLKVSKISNTVVSLTVLQGLKSGFPQQFIDGRIEDKLSIFM